MALKAQSKQKPSLDLGRWRASSNNKPHQRAEIQLERAAKLQLCIAKLNEQQRLIIEQCYLLGKTQQQIAEDLAMPLGSVKTNARRGLIAIRKMLECSGSGEQAK